MLGLRITNPSSTDVAATSFHESKKEKEKKRKKDEGGENEMDEDESEEREGRWKEERGDDIRGEKIQSSVANSALSRCPNSTGVVCVWNPVIVFGLPACPTTSTACWNKMRTDTRRIEIAERGGMVGENREQRL